MQPWWWRSLAACASVLVLAGLVALVAGAVAADRATALRLAAEDSASSSDAPAPPAAAASGGSPGGARVDDALTATTVNLPPGWRVVPTQDVVEVPPGRFEGATIARRGQTVVLVGLADPARVRPRADPAVGDPAEERALDAEARRLADAYADLLAPGAETAELTDDAVPIGGLPTRTSVRRVEGGELDGALTRVSTVAAPGRTLAVLAVARPSPTLVADADAADTLVRSLRPEPGLVPRPARPPQPSRPAP